jgi:hypothetical protein
VHRAGILSDIEGKREENRVQDLLVALEHRITIGMLIVRWMPRPSGMPVPLREIGPTFDMNQDAAFAYLRRHFQNQNRTLYDVAGDVASSSHQWDHSKGRGRRERNGCRVLTTAPAAALGDC